MRSSLFWDVTWRILVLGYRRFGTTCRYYLHRSSSVSFPIFFSAYIFTYLLKNLCRWSVLKTSGLDAACEILKCGMICQWVLAWSNDVMNLTRGVSWSWEEAKPLTCEYYEVKNVWTYRPTSTSPYSRAWCVIEYRGIIFNYILLEERQPGYREMWVAKSGTAVAVIKLYFNVLQNRLLWICILRWSCASVLQCCIPNRITHHMAQFFLNSCYCLRISLETIFKNRALSTLIWPIFCVT
jgi:hypothetical protein